MENIIWNILDCIRRQHRLLDVLHLHLRDNTLRRRLIFDYLRLRLKIYMWLGGVLLRGVSRRVARRRGLRLRLVC